MLKDRLGADPLYMWYATDVVLYDHDVGAKLPLKMHLFVHRSEEQSALEISGKFNLNQGW